MFQNIRKKLFSNLGTLSEDSSAKAKLSHEERSVVSENLDRHSSRSSTRHRHQRHQRSQSLPRHSSERKDSRKSSHRHNERESNNANKQRTAVVEMATHVNKSANETQRKRSSSLPSKSRKKLHENRENKDKNRTAAVAVGRSSRKDSLINSSSLDQSPGQSKVSTWLGLDNGLLEMNQQEADLPALSSPYSAFNQPALSILNRPSNQMSSQVWSGRPPVSSSVYSASTLPGSALAGNLADVPHERSTVPPKLTDLQYSSSQFQSEYQPSAIQSLAVRQKSQQYASSVSQHSSLNIDADSKSLSVGHFHSENRHRQNIPTHNLFQQQARLAPISPLATASNQPIIPYFRRSYTTEPIKSDKPDKSANKQCRVDTNQCRIQANSASQTNQARTERQTKPIVKSYKKLIKTDAACGSHLEQIETEKETTANSNHDNNKKNKETKKRAGTILANFRFNLKSTKKKTRLVRGSNDAPSVPSPPASSGLSINCNHRHNRHRNQTQHYNSALESKQSQGFATSATKLPKIKSSSKQGGERVGWEYHNITLSRVPVYGFGIAVSGGRDNPHFMNGEPSIAISDVLKAGPAEGKLMVNDRVISANGISLENVDYNQAIQVLRECGNTVNLLIKRRALVTQPNGNGVAESNNNLVKLSLTKANKKEDFGIVLGCKIYVKEITNRSALSEKDGSLQEGDIIHKINNTNADNITLKEAKKLLESCKEKVSLVISRDLSSLNNINNQINSRFLAENGNYINGHQRNGSGILNVYNQSHQRWPSNGLDSASHNNNANSKDNIYSGQNDIGADIAPSLTPNNNNGNNNSSSLPPNHQNSSIASMANGRVNGWSNQNLYVQPPTRSDFNQTNNQNSASFNSQPQLPTSNGSFDKNENSSFSSRIRGPLSDISLNQLDQPATPMMVGQSRPTADSSVESSQRPLPQRPSQIEPPNSDNNSPPNETKTTKNDHTFESPAKSKPVNINEVRYISFLKEGSVGIRLTGGNEVGIFVTAVQPGSPASIQGLQVGDKILKANSTDMTGFTREEAVLYLLKIKDKIDLVVQNCKEEYEDIVANQKGDSFYIRTHFNYDSEGKGELSFHVGDVFHVVDTLFNGVVGSWFVYRLGQNNQEIQKGSIPNKSRAEQLGAEQHSENRSKKSMSGTDLNLGEGSSRRGNFFKRRRSARRSKSLSKDHWEDVVFGDSNSKFPAYERVNLKHQAFTRPVVFFGPLADIAREKLVKDFPDKFALPQALNVNEDDAPKSSKMSSSGIVRLSSIKEVIEKGKHALLDITPSAVDRLNYAQFYPIVIFMRAENKSTVKELRNRSSSKSTVHRSSRKLFEQSIKLEKLWHHIFTSSMTLTNGVDLWYKKLQETIEKQQSQNIWVSETKPEENISDDFLFPMISRLSYASSPESDLDISANDSRLDDDDNDDKESRYIPTGSVGNRLVKSSSDPSLAPGEEASKTLNGPNLDSKQQSAHSFATSSNEDGFKMNRSNNNNKSNSNINFDNNQRSPTKQLPLHILLKKELSKALNYDSKEKASSKQAAADTTNTAASDVQPDKSPQNITNNDISNYPTLRAGERYPQDPIYNVRQQESPLPPPPPTSFPPGTPTSKVQIQPQCIEAPPRIDRNSKPSRFRSAHERLFGSKSVTSTSNSSSHLTNGNYQIDDGDYINTSSPVKCEASNQPSKPVQNGNSQQRFVTGAFGDTSSYSSDSYNKYGSPSSTLDIKQEPANMRSAVPTNDPYRFTRSTAQPLPHSSNLSSKHSSLERSKPLPPPPLPQTSLSKVELPPTSLTSTFSKAPPSPPPKPAYKYGAQSLQYQLNSMSIHDNRPPPPPKPSSNPASSAVYDKQISQGDYDNMPSIYQMKSRPSSFHNSFDISNGPPGYYQSLPQSSYAYQPKDTTLNRHSSTAETISNFMNGNYNNAEQPSNGFSSIRKPPSGYLDTINGEMGATYLPSNSQSIKTHAGSSPTKSTYSSNYDSMRYSSMLPEAYMIQPNGQLPHNYVQQQSQSHHLNNGPYLNVPFPPKPYSQDSSLSNPNYCSVNAQSSPLPPPPPLPSYSQLHGGSQTLLQPTPQQLQSGQYLDLSVNRENRGSAFEVYRKPGLESMHAQLLSESQMFQGLPPPPPPLTVNDFNHVNYTNIDEITSTSSMFVQPKSSQASVSGSVSGIGGQTCPQLSTVIATARGIFDSEGGSLVSSETGVNILIPPGAISPGVTQEIYFKVCRDNNLAPPLDKDKGETLLSPIVMCGPHGLRFNVPIELRLPHCAIVNPESWSFALKSSDTSNGEPAGWRNITVNNGDGITGNDFNEQFVSVLVDHF